MKSFRILLTTILALTIVVSCRDEEKIPVDVERAAGTAGAYVRHIDVVSATYDLFDLDNSKFVIEVEAVDGKKGTDFEDVEFLVTFKDNTPGNGTITLPEKSVKTVSRSEFAKDEESGLPRATVTITANEALAALGMQQSDVDGGDQFIFREVITLPNGQAFSNNNASPDVLGGAFFNTPFRTTVTVVCPSELAKTYDAHTEWTDYYGDPGDNDFTETFVQNTNAGGTPIPGQYKISDLSGGMEPIVWGSAKVAATVADACGTVELVSAPYSYPYYINAGSFVDANTGVITIVWENFYGENGVTVYTPQ